MLNKIMFVLLRFIFGVFFMGDVFNMRYFLIGGGMIVVFFDIVLFWDMFRFLSSFYDV